MSKSLSAFLAHVGKVYTERRRNKKKKDGGRQKCRHPLTKSVDPYRYPNEYQGEPWSTSFPFQNLRVLIRMSLPFLIKLCWVVLR
jgi:hypothetical protein